MCTILVAEDNDDVRALVDRLLTRRGYQVISVPHGGAAAEVLDDPATHVDLVLSDVTMPIMTGPELAERVRQLRPELPLLFMSGHSPGELAAVGAVNYLQKPFSPSELVDAVTLAMAG